MNIAVLYLKLKNFYFVSRANERHFWFFAGNNTVSNRLSIKWNFFFGDFGLEWDENPGECELYLLIDEVVEKFHRSHRMTA